MGGPFFVVERSGTSLDMKLILVLLLFLAACGRQEPPTPTPAQSDQLNEAEDMLNGMAANEEGPADRSASPSNSTE
jgi:hypothetical protein